MGLMICGKCHSESTYYQGGGYACMMCGNRSPSRWGFHRQGEQIKPPEPIEEYQEPDLEDEEIEEEEIDMGKKRTPEQRERIAAGIRAALAKKKAAAGGGQNSVEKKSKPPKPAAAPPLPREEVARNRERAGLAPATVEVIKERIRTAAAKKVKPDYAQLIRDAANETGSNDIGALIDHAVKKLVGPPDIRMSLTPEDPRHVLLDFNLEENKHLLEPWTAYCRKSRRGPGDHAMQLIEETLKAASAI